MHKLAEFSIHDEHNSANITDTQPLWERRCNFEGYVLKAGWTDEPPFIYTTNISNKGETLSGVNYDLAISLANMCNFTLQFERIDVYGSLQEGNWTGIVKKLHNKELDIGIASFTRTFERDKVIDFSIGIHTHYYVLFMKTSKEVVQWMTFINAFSKAFWFCLITFVTSLTVFLCIIKIKKVILQT